MYSSALQLSHLGLDKGQRRYLFELLQGTYAGFSGNISRALVLERSSFHRTDQATGVRRQAQLVCSVTVTADMLNVAGGVHGACSAYLADLCTSLCLAPLRTPESWDVTGLSIKLSVTYLSVPRLGERLRIESATTAVGGRVAEIVCTILNESQSDRHVITASHVKLNAFAKEQGSAGPPASSSL